MERSRSWRRAQRDRAIAHALPIVSTYFPHANDLRTRALKYADNLRKCSCSMCNSGDPHDHRQFKRADAALRDEWN